MEKLGILYFSSTGNSLYIAVKLKEKFGCPVLYIPTYEGDASEFDRVIIVTPIYSYGMPVHVLELFSHLGKKTEIIAVQNYGGMVGGADRLFYEYACRYGLNIASVYTIKMPENFTLVMSPPEFYKNSVLRSADKRIAVIASAIGSRNYRIPAQKRTKEKTYLKNKANWRLIGERFSTTGKCVKCLKCVEICPVRNISLVDGKISFADKCVACLGCFHRCPQEAIIYRNKDNKKRYVNPLVNESEIGKNLS